MSDKLRKKLHSQQKLLDQSNTMALEEGHRVCKLVLLKKFDIAYRRIWLNSRTHQIVLEKWSNNAKATEIDGSSPSTSMRLLNNGFIKGGTIPTPSTSKSIHSLDIRLIKDANILGEAGNTMQIVEKWRKDPVLQRFSPGNVLCIRWGSTFVLNNWIILFDNPEECQLWSTGIQQLCAEQTNISHALLVERWLCKQFFTLLSYPTNSATITIKQMKPFVQQRLQCKVNSKQLQEITEGEMGFQAFVLAHNSLLNFHTLFQLFFQDYSSTNSPAIVPFQRFMDFLRNVQHDEMGKSRELLSNYLRRYLRDVDPDRDEPEPWLTTEEFVDYLFSADNSLFDPVNKNVVQDMTKPLTHYWISSSHNTYLTGDQLKSESSLDAYARALLMGCRCIELDCWDGPQRKGSNGESVIDIVIYHGYTMTSKLSLRDVLHTIKHYAFQTSEFPLILSIEDNCSVPAQRQMASDIKDVLGEILLTAPISRDEWQLPSPQALRRKIILKHKKLQINDENSPMLSQSIEEDFEQDILSRRCVRKGVLWLKGGPIASLGSKSREWTKHLFVLFNDRLCFLIQPVEETISNRRQMAAENENDSLADQTEKKTKKSSIGRENSVSSMSDDADESGSSIADGCVDAHIAEEWFHGKIDRDAAKNRLVENCGLGNGLFLVRESTTFIGDFTLSFLHNGSVHHCRIKTSLSPGGEQRYHLLDSMKRDTLYELISFYTKHPLDTPNFKVILQTTCPQPQSFLNEPWFSATADTKKAEELLNAVSIDGAFLIRYSSSDRNVFVLSLRVDEKIWHYRLKKEGRIFVVSQHMFESLNQLVEYYTQNQFVQGVCLKYPVNENSIDKYSLADSSLIGNNAEFKSPFDGCYMDLNDLDHKLQVMAVEAFDGNDPELDKLIPKPDKLLTFPIGAQITILQKGPGTEDSLIWMGRFNNEIGWFPVRCVQELKDEMTGISNLNSFGTIELIGSIFEQCISDRPHTFRICLAESHWNVKEYVLAAENKEELDEWLVACQSQLKLASDKASQLRTREKQLKIASELSSLVVYCQAVSFNSIDFELQDPHFSFYEMCSFSECKLEKLLERGLSMFNQRQLSRVYPAGSRIMSTNFDPIPMWNSGCHMVALNFQSGDKAMQLNVGRFSENGCCGYVLKPQYLMDETFRPSRLRQQSSLVNLCEPSNSNSDSNLEINGPQQKKNPLVKPMSSMPSIHGLENRLPSDRATIDPNIQSTNIPKNQYQCCPLPVTLHLHVIAGRHLSRKSGYDKGGICSPFVEIELLGFVQDQHIQRTSTITSNGLNPIWNERFTFQIQYPEIALLRFLVEDGDFVGPKTDPFIGQAVFPVDCVRPGCRSVPLLNHFSEPLELSALLIHLEVRLSSTANGNNLQPNSTFHSVRNIHQLLQADRSVHNGTNIPPITSTQQLNRNISMESNGGGREIHLDARAGFVQPYRLNLAASNRAASAESPEIIDSSQTSASQATKRPGTKALRRIFRLERN